MDTGKCILCVYYNYVRTYIWHCVGTCTCTYSVWYALLLLYVQTLNMYMEYCDVRAFWSVFQYGTHRNIRLEIWITRARSYPCHTGREVQHYLMLFHPHPTHSSHTYTCMHTHHAHTHVQLMVWVQSYVECCMFRGIHVSTPLSWLQTPGSRKHTRAE